MLKIEKDFNINENNMIKVLMEVGNQLVIINEKLDNMTAPKVPYNFVQGFYEVAKQDDL